MSQDNFELVLIRYRQLYLVASMFNRRKKSRPVREHIRVIKWWPFLWTIRLKSSCSDGDAIKVFVRVRPLTQGTGLMTDGDHSLCLTVSSPHTVRLHSKPEPRTFTYDHVADMNTSQVRQGFGSSSSDSSVLISSLLFMSRRRRFSPAWLKTSWSRAWMDTTGPFLPSEFLFGLYWHVLEPWRIHDVACLFFSGQTGSGKTFTMLGKSQTKDLASRPIDQCMRTIYSSSQNVIGHLW